LELAGILKYGIPGILVTTGAESKVVSEALILKMGLHNPRECVVSPKG